MGIVHTAWFESPIGTMFAASTESGLGYLGLPHANGRGFDGWLRRHAPEERCVAGYTPNRDAIAQVLEFLDGKREVFELDLDIRGTPFQQEVYDEVRRIGFGEQRSYGEVARAIGRATAMRAVGAANSANPIPLIIPCHRVVEARGRLGGYGGGVELKARLLAMEHSRPAPGTLL